MTCAPLGISRTYSARVGRTATSRALRVVRTVTPSGCPITSSCASTPAWVWNSPPAARVTRWRRRLASTRSTRSPAAKTRATSAHLLRWSTPVRRPARPSTAALRLDEPDRTDLGAEPAERADVARRGRPAHPALPQLVALVVGITREALVTPLEEAEEERRLRSRRPVLQRVEHLLVPEVPIARGHGALLYLVVDALEHAVGRGLA